MHNERTVGICIPIYYREEKVKDSLESILNTDLSGSYYKISAQLHFGINGCSEEFHFWLYSDLIPRAQAKGFTCSLYDKWGTNLGKPEAVNRMVAHMETGGAPKYIVSFDSDIVVTQNNWLYKLIEAYESYNGIDRIGALCPNQTEECCHTLEHPKIHDWGSRDKAVHNHSVRYAPGNHGVAGGVLFTPYRIWSGNKGYKAHRKYASDDGHYAQSLWLHGQYYMAVLDSVSVRHPGGDDVAYSNWKRQIIEKNLDNKDIKDFF